MNEKQLRDYMRSTPAGQTRFAAVAMRRWYNPVRYIRGRYYFAALGESTFEGIIKKIFRV